MATQAAERPPRQLRFKRNDVVRFRKRSQIAAGLGVGLDKEFKVEMVAHEGGRTMVVLRVGEGKHSALIQVPPGHLAVINRGPVLLKSGSTPPPRQRRPRGRWLAQDEPQHRA